MLSLFRRALWNRIPRQARIWLRVIAGNALAPRLARGIPAAEPICVAGFLSSAAGVGEGARLCRDALQLLGYDVRSLDLSRGFGLEELPPEILCGPTPGTGTVIIHLNPDQLPFALAMAGRRLLEGKRIIGYWAWELPRVPPHWRRAIHHVDEVWVPSQFVAAALRPFADKPVRVVPHPAAIGVDGQRRRGEFGINEGCFVALTIFHMNSCFARKNPLAAIAAFRAALGNDANALLIVKVADGASGGDLMDMLRQAVAAAGNIRVIDKIYNQQQMHDLIASVDVVISLHRAEGFGLVLAQAMLSGTAVIATAWSGNLDFMTNDSAELIGFDLVRVDDPQGCYVMDGQLWAEPKLTEAATALARLAANRARLSALAEAGCRQATRSLSLDIYREAVAGSLGPARSSRSR
jgi:glycosyltransferase involved in cell wall biosynthesis